MYCLLNDAIQWDQYVLAALHWGSIAAVLFGIYKLFTEGRAAGKQ